MIECPLTLSSLGDRHCENILLFDSNALSFHVDFSCIFEKVCPPLLHLTLAGQTLGYP